MIEKMTKYSWILLSDRKDSFIETAASLGVIDICRSEKPVDEHSQMILDSIEEARSEIRTIESGEDAHLVSLLAEQKRLLALAREAEVWGEFDPSALRALKDDGLEIRLHCVQDKKFDPLWAEGWPLEIIEKKDGRTWFATVGADDFPVKAIPLPEKTAGEFKRDAQEIQEQVDAYRAHLESRRGEIPELKALILDKTAELDSYLASTEGVAAAENRLTVYEGFAPKENEKAIREVFDSSDIYYFCEDARVEDNPPIKFRNNRFVRLFEPLTDMYGRPSYDGFDPTPFISIFFLLFFAMCMGDMGYGLILFAAGFLLKKAGSFARFAPLVSILGVGTIIIGFFFHTFFSIDFSQAPWLPEWARSVMVPSSVAGYDGTMVLALVTGIIHLCLAMIVKTVNETRNKGFLESLATWGWTLLFTGAVAVGAAALAGVIDKALTKTILIVLGIVCAIGIFPLNNLHRNPLVNVGSGLWDAYNMATGILGDVLSYLRLYALGLAGAMLGFAFNDLAKMALGDGGARWVAFILIVVIGHTLNLAMAALGAFVHPLRLNFLEFFKNSGYEGSGKKYRPLGNNDNK